MVRKMLGEKGYISRGAYYPQAEVRRMDIARRVFAGAAAFLMILGALLVLIPTNSQAAANPVPVLALKLDTAQQAARVTESAPGIVSFTGQATIDKLPVERCVVTLTSSTDIGWVTQVSPSTAVFTATTPQSFTCTVVVPQGTPNSQFGNLIINGRAVAGGLQSLAETKAIISVDPYFRLTLDSDVPYREISPGTQAFFTVKLTNAGNAVDSFELEISNLKELAAKKWTVVLSANTIPKVVPGEYKPFRITAQSPRDWTPWKSEPSVFIIKAQSQNAKDFQQVITLSFPIYAYEKGFYIPGFDPLFLIAALGIGLVVLRRKRQ